MGATSNAYKCLQDLLGKLEAAGDTASVEEMLKVGPDAFSKPSNLPDDRKDMLLVVVCGRHLAMDPLIVSKWQERSRASRWPGCMKSLAKTRWDDPKQARDMQPTVYLLK